MNRPNVIWPRECSPAPGSDASVHTQSAVDVNRWYKVVITAVDLRGHDGRFLATRQNERNGPVELNGSITVSYRYLPPGAPPEKGTDAWVSDVRRKEKGWRAYKIRYHSPGEQLQLPLLQVEGGS